MNENTSIKKMLQVLAKHGILCTKEMEKDLQKLITTDIEKFIGVFVRDFIRKDFEHYNKFEKLRNLTPNQKKRLDGNILRRYEYRNASNFRCIFIVYTDNNTSMPVLLCAFNEDGNKKNGKNAYNKNIDRAIDIYERVFKA